MGAGVATGVGGACAGGACAGGAGDGAIWLGMAVLPASSTSWRLPPRALAMACSSRAARLCTMPIQFPATCTTARLASRRTSWPCCERSIRVDGNSKLPRICCQSSGRLLETVSETTVVTWGSSGAGAEVLTGSGVAVGPVLAGGSGRSVGVGLAAGSEVVPVGGTVVGRDAAAAGAVTGAAAGNGSASSPSSSTSSHSRG